MKPLTLIEKAFFLKKVKPFVDLDLDLLLAIAEKLYVDEYDKNESVFSIGQSANRVYLIFQGNVLLLDEKGHFLSELEASDFFGEESLFNEQPRSYLATCKTDSLLFALSRSHLLSIISECPSVAVLLLQSYAKALPCRYKS